MTVPVITFFDNKGGVGKTTLVYHIAWMLAEKREPTLVMDLDPQANLTAAFLPEERLEELWEAPQDRCTTIARSVDPLLHVGDILNPDIEEVASGLWLVAGDLGLARYEDELANQWRLCFDEQNRYRAFRVTTAFWQIAQEAAARAGARRVLVDVGPSLGALNRAALVASDHVVVPLAGDLFSIQGLRNLGPTLRAWRDGWKKRAGDWTAPSVPLPAGRMRPAGYVVQQHEVRLNRPVQAYLRWVDRLPEEYRRNILGTSPPTIPPVLQDPECLAMIKHFRSLVPMAQEARRPVFLLRPADGAIGGHAAAVQAAYAEFSTLVDKLLTKT